VTTRKAFQRCFVRAGNPVPGKKPLPKENLLTSANDWNLLIDYTHRTIVFPPSIYATNQRPDGVIWSKMSRSVILLELTCCAEEGLKAAQLRKEVRYQELIENVRASGWRAELLTIEVGARGLIGNRCFRAFVKLGLSSSVSSSLCKTLSIVVARCSYAIYLAHSSLTWSHNTDLVIL